MIGILIATCTYLAVKFRRRRKPMSPISQPWSKINASGDDFIRLPRSIDKRRTYRRHHCQSRY